MQVGDFVIQERIGAGGMGVVYRATHPLIGKQVAIKVLRAELVSQQQVERLLIEARAVNAIRHPGIIDIFGFGDLPDGRPYIIMELLQGHSLSALIREQGRLDVNTAVWVLDQILAALSAAHRAGVVHRDLKPGNVFIAEGLDGTRSVKLVDFGIAKLVQSQDGPTTVDGAILGTPEFMAPEQIRGAAVSPATDMYALGIIAFQMLTGARPFNGEAFQVMFAHIEQEPPPPSSRAAGIPPEFDTFVLQLLAKQPALRPKSADAAREALRRIPSMEAPRPTARTPLPNSASAPQEQTRTTTLPAMPQPAHPASSRAPRWIAGAALLVGVAGGTFLLWPEQPDGVPAAPVVAEPKPVVATVAEVPRIPAPSAPERASEEAPPGAQPAQEPTLAAAPLAVEPPAQEPAPSSAEVLAAEPPGQEAQPAQRAPSKLRGKGSKLRAEELPRAGDPARASLNDLEALLNPRRVQADSEQSNVVSPGQGPPRAQETPPPPEAKPSTPAGAAVAPEGRANGLPDSPQPSEQGQVRSTEPSQQAAPPTRVAIVPERRELIYPRTGPQPKSTKLVAQLSRVEAKYLQRPGSHPRRLGLEQELLRLHALAVTAQTAHEVSELMVKLYGLEKRITSYPSQPAPKSPDVEKNAQPQEKPASTGSLTTKDRVIQYQRSLLERIDKDERLWREKTGSSDGRPAALLDLFRIREQVRVVSGSQKRTELTEELFAWERQHLKAANQSPP